MTTYVAKKTETGDQVCELLFDGLNDHGCLVVFNRVTLAVEYLTPDQIGDLPNESLSSLDSSYTSFNAARIDALMHWYKTVRDMEVVA